MREIKFSYPSEVERIIKEWEYLKLQFKDYPDYANFIDRTIIDLKKLAFPILLIKKEQT